MKEIVVFTDGSCIGNGKKITFAGYGIHFPNNEFPDISEPFTLSPKTNQRTELFAILKVLQLLTPKDYDKIIIYTDSEYSLKAITQWAIKWEKNGWNTTKGSVKNLDIIKPLHELYQHNKKRIVIKHVRSHTGKDDFLSIGNAEADRLAVLGSKQSFGIKKKPMQINKKDLKVAVPTVSASSSSPYEPSIKVIIKRKSYNNAPKKKRRVKLTIDDI